MELCMRADEVRKQFLEFFKKRGHQIVRSSSLVPSDDPTLLFTNAGMVQFKRSFLGEENRGYKRATTSQKCVRAGGKHNDLENVGYTARHHTFFEMLGNFSFGDYFKEKAIEFGWDLMTSIYGFPEEKLWVSVFLEDDEAYDLWHRNIGVPEDRIVRFGEEDNFWAMGDTGPCGPCSEILIDRGEAFGCGRPECRVGCECDRYLEIWNLVFMQFNRDPDGKMIPLPKPSIDTGMGLERVVSVIQNVKTNFDTDLILPIIKKVEHLSERRFGESVDDDVAMKVIADHARAAAFLIGDGVLPSNEGRGYVLRRIMRRAIRYGRNIGLTQPFLNQTAEVVFDIMKSAYPELSEGRAFISNVIKNEEVRFSETLGYGLKLLDETLSDLKAKGLFEVPGKIIFKLYDTYGFPVDIVQDVVRDENLSLDMEGFNQLMQAQREKSRSTSVFSEIKDVYKRLSSKGIKPEFIGYDALSTDSKVIVLVKDGDEINTAVEGDRIEILTEVTPFYGEAGGQVGDTGKISNENFMMEISDTSIDPTGLIIHRGEIVSGQVTKGATVHLAVDKEKRRSTALNHTATHILHAVLRQILGDHIKQAGSRVSPGGFRFDFTHFSQVDGQTLDQIEVLVNERIRENIPLQVDEMDAEDAFKTGATALFEEKYGDRVRVISLSTFSKELCGGTHTDQTGNIGLFNIVGESSIASGVRRIEALTGGGAVDHVQRLSRIVRNVSLLVKEKPKDLPLKIGNILDHQRSLEKEVERLKANLAIESSEKYEDDIRSVNGMKVLSKRVDVETPAALRDLADRFKEKLKSGIVVLGSVVGTKALLVAVVSKDLTHQYHAGNIVKQISAIVGGRGGGRPDMAQAGGTRPENLDKALEKVYELF